MIWRWRRRVPVVLQASLAECGAAALSMVLGYFGRHTPVREARELLGIGRDGTTAAGIVRVAEGLGLRVSAYRCAPEAFGHVRAPAVLHWRGNHFVVLERWGPHRVSIVDPANGRRVLSRAEFDASATGVVLELSPTERFERKAGQRGAGARFVLRFVPRMPSLFGLVLAASAVLTLVALLPAVLTRYVVDAVIAPNRTDLLGVLAAGVAALVAGQTLVGYARRELLLRLRSRLDLGMMGAFLGHLFRLPYAYFQLRTSGDLLTRVSSSMILRELVSTHLFTLLLDGVSAIVYICLLWAVWPELALLVVGLGIAQVVIALAFARPVRRATDREMASMAAAQSHLVDALGGMESLKAAGAEDVVLHRWRLLYRRQLSATIQEGALRNGMDALSDLIRVGAPLALLLIGAHGVLAGHLSLGTMLAANLLAGMALSPISALSQVYQSLQAVGTHIGRLRDVLDEQPEQPNREGLRHGPIVGALQLEQVTFRYQPSAPAALSDIDVEIAAGSYVAIVGRTGSGKSTLARLLVGLYQAQHGRVLFDGRPLPEFDLAAIRRQCGIVVQDAAIYSGTILENLTVNAPETPLARVLDAARAACLHEDVLRMPLGYDTPLGEGGGGLSGGQRQRLAIARALVNQPRVLVLDEATSHLDARTEAQIQANLLALRCTRVVIAHRLSTVIDADLILVVDGGRVVERGRHHDLLRADGPYAQLVAAQLPAGRSLMAVHRGDAARIAPVSE